MLPEGMGLYKANTHMECRTMSDEKISLRIDSKDLEEMDAYLKDHPELGSRSLFIRTAVRAYVNRDADVTSDVSDGNTVKVRLTPYEMEVIKDGVGKFYLSEEEFIRSLIKRAVMEEGMAESEMRKAFTRVATSNIPL